MKTFVTVLLASAWMVGAASAGEGDAGKPLVAKHDNVVIVGDSITADGQYAQMVQDLLDENLPELSLNVLSRGQSGDTVSGTLSGRFQEDVLDSRPDWLLVNLGINDLHGSVEDYLRNYEVFINRVYRDTKARIGIISPIYIDSDGDHAQEEAFVAGIKALAAKYECLYIPCCEQFKAIRPTLPAKWKYAPDGIHANRLGYWIFAEMIANALGCPLPQTERTVEIPASWVTKSADSAGQEFTLPLPQPLHVKLVRYEPSQAVAERVSKPVKVDGKLNDWDMSDAITLGWPQQHVLGVVSAKRPTFFGKARAKFAYDDKYLYFAIEVDDAIVRNRDIPGLVNRDCVELFIDGRKKEDRSNPKAFIYNKTTPNVLQYMLPPATAEKPKAEVLMGNGNPAMAKDVLYATSLVPYKGYQEELAIPLSSFAEGKLELGMTIGFDVSFIDVEQNERFDWANIYRCSGWVGAFYTTEYFGTLTMGEPKPAAGQK